MKPVDPALLPHLRPARGPLAAVLGAGVVGGLLVVAQAFALGTLVVLLVRDPGGSAWHGAAWATVAVLAARALASYAGDTAAARAATAVSSSLRRRLLAATLERDATALDRERTGELTLLATRGVAATEPYLTRYVPSLVLAAVLPVLTMAAIAVLDPLSAVIVVCTLPLVPVFAILIGLVTRDRADLQWRRLGALSGHFLDVVRGLPTLVAHRRAAAQSTAIHAISERHRRATVDTLRVAFTSSAVLELIATISVALVAVAVGLRLAAGSMDFGTAMIVLLLAPEAYWPLRRVGAEFHAAAEGTAAFARIGELLDSPSAARGSAPVPAGAPIEVDGLDLLRPGRAVPALSGVRATIPPRGLTAITGPSGCGKSTLLAVLLGELAPTAGAVRVGHTELADLDPEAWRAATAWSPQRPWLTSGTIRDNVRTGVPDAGDARVWHALEAVDLGEVVASLPDGLDTALGEDGAGLSAGQRARLALARVVLADRPWVFLDEPSAHLDEHTESVVLTTLRRIAERSAVVVVAHRQAVVDAADHVVALPAPATEPEAGPVPVTARPTPVVGVDEEPEEPARWGRRTATALGSGSVAAGVALTATAGWLLTRASEHPPVLHLMVAIVAVRTFGLARPALRYAERLVSHDTALRLLARRRVEVWEALVPLTPGRLGVRRGDLLASVVDDVDALLDAELRVRQPVQTALLVVAGAALLAGWVTPLAGLLTAALGLAGVLAWWVARRGARRAEPVLVAARGDLAAGIAETLDGARDLVSWQAGDAALDRIDVDGDRLAAAARATARASAVGRAILTIATALALAATALWVAGPATGPVLALLVLLPVALADALAPLPDAGALGVRTRAAADRLDALTRRTPAFAEPAIPASPPDSSAVSLCDVTAGWGRTPALRGVDLDLSPGARVGVVGPSGSGKSTLAAVLLAFLDPSTGEARLGGSAYADLGGERVRERVGLVDDDPYVFASTLLENVRLARPGAGDDEVASALERAGLGGWIAGLPDGTATLVGEGHARVSGGERARIGIARALLADQPVLVLDEPTAHLDSDTARRVADGVLDLRRGRSVVWITHADVGLDRLDSVLALGGDPVRAPGGRVSPRG